MKTKPVTDVAVATVNGKHKHQLIYSVASAPAIQGSILIQRFRFFYSVWQHSHSCIKSIFRSKVLYRRIHFLEYLFDLQHANVVLFIPVHLAYFLSFEGRKFWRKKRIEKISGFFFNSALNFRMLLCFCVLSMMIKENKIKWKP